MQIILIPGPVIDVEEPVEGELGAESSVDLVRALLLGQGLVQGRQNHNKLGYSDGHLGNTKILLLKIAKCYLCDDFKQKSGKYSTFIGIFLFLI